MKIAVLSDSHTKVEYTKEVLSFLKEEGAQYVIHAGDLCLEANLKSLEENKLPYVSVFGNNDESLKNISHKYFIKVEPYYFKIEDIKFKLMHMPYYLSGDCDVIIFGHTHIFESEYTNNTLFLNPGEVCAREKPLIECVLLEINDHEFIVNYYSKNINEKNFKREKRNYERN